MIIYTIIACVAAYLVVARAVRFYVDTLAAEEDVDFEPADHQLISLMWPLIIGGFLYGTVERIFFGDEEDEDDVEW